MSSSTEERIRNAKRSSKKLNVYISQKALDRADRDETVKDNISRYFHEVRMLVREIESLNAAKDSEKIGEFKVSPKHHHNKFRVVWFRAKDHLGKEALYICDFIYHTSDKKYVSDWASRAEAGTLKRTDYEDFGELLLVDNPEEIKR